MLKDFLGKKKIEKVVDPVIGVLESSKKPVSSITNPQATPATRISTLVTDLEEYAQSTHSAINSVINEIVVENTGVSVFDKYYQLVQERYQDVYNIVDSGESYPKYTTSSEEIDQYEDQILDEVSDPRAPLLQVLFTLLQETNILQYYVAELLSPMISRVEKEVRTQQIKTEATLGVATDEKKPEGEPNSTRTLLRVIESSLDKYLAAAFEIRSLTRFDTKAILETIYFSWRDKWSPNDDSGFIQELQSKTLSLRGLAQLGRTQTKTEFRHAINAVRSVNLGSIVRRVASQAIAVQCFELMERFLGGLVSDLTENLGASMPHPASSIFNNGLLMLAKKMEEELLAIENRMLVLFEASMIAKSKAHENHTAANLDLAIGNIDGCFGATITKDPLQALDSAINSIPAIAAKVLQVKSYVG